MARLAFALLLAIGTLIVALKRRRARLPARAVIVTPRRSTAIARDGAVRSAQTAELSVDPSDLEELWHPTNLENLARTYWRFLSRVTLGLIRVIYGHNERCVVFLIRPLTLLRFESPEYVLEPDHGMVRWRIRDGLLVTRRGRSKGYLALDVTRAAAPDSDGRVRLTIEVEVANFYPAIAARFSTPVYRATQSVVHVLVTHGFLRSLAALDLATSRVGQLSVPADGAQDGAGAAAEQPTRAQP